MDRVLLVCFALSAIGLTLLGILAVASEPRPLPIARLGRYEGQRVCVDATLAHLRPTVGDTRRILLVQGNDSVPGRVRFAWEAVAGDLVHACGTLGRESGTLLLQVDRVADVRILQRWDEEVVALAILAERPWEHLDRKVATVGDPIVEGRSTFLSDEPTGARLRLATSSALGAGPTRVEGVLAYDAGETRFALQVEGHRSVTM